MLPFTVTPPTSTVETLPAVSVTAFCSQVSAGPDRSASGSAAQDLFPELLLGKLRTAVIVGDAVALLRGGNGLQIGKVVQPNLPCRPGHPRRRGVEHRQDRHTAAEDHLAVGIPDRRLDLALVFIGIRSPVGPGLLLTDIGLAAGGIRADVRGISMISTGLDFIISICPAATAWALSASSSKEAGISARTTPTRYSPTVISRTSSPSRTFSTVSPSSSPGTNGPSATAQPVPPKKTVPERKGTNHSQRQHKQNGHQHSGYRHALPQRRHSFHGFPPLMHLLWVVPPSYAPRRENMRPPWTNFLRRDILGRNVSLKGIIL